MDENRDLRPYFPALTPNPEYLQESEWLFSAEDCLHACASVIVDYVRQRGN
ncbi:hypothetical protein CHS0354_011762 [Potamilus streckersoni]|uniref:Uncharacterized protein n=1 Tax=Potamilus streckersoni TaxID=2493646 RepID=A0AAE0WDU5_9BIVA|nr:hypothetical protein CHS0354_011762 [Potamilus streckersoni]